MYTQHSALGWKGILSILCLTRRSIASANENLRLNRNSYEAGTAPLTDLLDAHTQLCTARDRYTEACTNYCNALTAYRQAIGE